MGVFPSAGTAFQVFKLWLSSWHEFRCVKVGSRCKASTAAAPLSASQWGPPIALLQLEGGALHSTVLLLPACQGASLTLVVVGGGAGGVELLLAMQHRLQLDLAKAGRPEESHGGWFSF